MPKMVLPRGEKTRVLSQHLPATCCCCTCCCTCAACTAELQVEWQLNFSISFRRRAALAAERAGDRTSIDALSPSQLRKVRVGPSRAVAPHADPGPGRTDGRWEVRSGGRGVREAGGRARGYPGRARTSFSCWYIKVLF